ncbi:MAG: SdrD B-like domain-containing protein [Kiritimatiellia bacterium]
MTKYFNQYKLAALCRPWLPGIVLLIAALALPGSGRAVSISVVDGAGNPVSGFRWLVEEDTTTITTPGAQVADSVSLVIHKSYAPVVTNGHTDSSSATINLPAGRYIVSVLPDSGHTLSAAIITNGQSSVTVTVNAHPVPTAQISILVFADHNPINNVYDAEESGLAGFKIMLADLGGSLSTDAYGNPLGTTYQQDAEGNFITDADGNYAVAMMGSGVISSGTNGEAIVKYLAPGKYGVTVAPPPGTDWVQTSTIEGTPTIDAWVKANEPSVFVEGFGGGFKHVVFGFTSPTQTVWATNPPPVAASNGRIRGKLVYNHFSKPPKTQGFYPGEAVPDGWIGLNDLAAATKGLYAAECGMDGSFIITNVPPGEYQLVTWDKPLDALFGINTVMVSNGADLNLGNVFCFRWFGALEGYVFYDTNENGFRDPGEAGIMGQAINLRFRDGTMYQTRLTEPDGSYSFSEVFPFFKWLVAEVDFARYKATGMTAVTDDGGEVLPDNGWAMPSRNKLTPQPQVDMDTNSASYGQPVINPNTGNNLSRTETGPVLTQAMMLFLNQINVIEWGKKDYAPGENGGISGIVYYDTTRAEDDPTDSVGEPWEPGVPRVQVNLYSDADGNGVIDDINGNGIVDLADIDNYPFGWQSGETEKGPEDVDRNGSGVFDPGDAINIVHADSWDDSPPTGSIMTNAPVIHGQRVTPGFDGFGTWNQVRPGVFDGGYAFGSYFPKGMTNGAAEVDGLPAGYYIVEAAAPPSYEHFKSQDKNVDFGDSYQPSKQLVPPVASPTCVGDAYVVPAELSLFPGVAAPLAGQTLRMPDRKHILLQDGKNAGVNFFLFTPVPKAARAVGFVNNDLAAEFDPTSPVFGEKAAPAWLPVAFEDYAGNEILRVYTDEFGGYNALLPSTFTVNVPSPSGVSPNMLTLVLNKPTMPDPNHPGERIMDPFHNPNYSVTPWTFHYYPATVSYLDTPLVPVASFVGDRYRVLDIEAPTRTPLIHEVYGPAGGAVVGSATDVVTIVSVGPLSVPNPDYYLTTTNSEPAYIIRDYGFGIVQGIATVGTTPLTILSWADGVIQARVPPGTPSGQLRVRRADSGLISRMGVILTVNESGATVRHVFPASYPAHPIQDAVDAAAPGDLILVHPGTYDENVVLWKPVRLQGSGSPSTLINANPAPSERITAWHTKVQGLLGTPGTDPFAAMECPGVLVLGTVAGYPFGPASSARIDGFTLYGSLMGGGVYVYQNVTNLHIGNNRIQGNQGEYGGGIGAWQPDTAVSGNNAGLLIHDNYIVKNGGISGGGGISIFNGCPNYVITNNYIVGNLSRNNGAGICHYGLCTNSTIANNQVAANEVFYGVNVNGAGGGIYAGGELVPGGISAGAGTLTIANNLIQGNLAGGNNGGGIAAERFNGQDVIGNPGATGSWHALYILNNMIVNNVAGYGGGGISLQDVCRSFIVNNTIVNNDSTATARLAFEAGSLNSTPQGAGIVSHLHSAAITNASDQAYADPVIDDCILRHNRSFYNDASFNNNAGGLATNTAMPYWDLQVAGLPNARLRAYNCLMTDPTGYDASNRSGNPRLYASYFNQLTIATILDEAGNNISVKINPIGIRGDYHLKAASPAIGQGAGRYLGSFPMLNRDFDGEARPTGAAPDIGADEYVDGNGNGIPDYWEQTYGITITSTSDADGDLFRDIDEYRAGTDPKDAESLLRILGFELLDGGAMRLQWQSVWGKRYGISRAGALDGTGYSLISTNLPADQPLNTADIMPGDASHAYFRIELDENDDDIIFSP